MSDEVNIERRGAVGWVHLNRPKALNALNLQMIDAVLPALDQMASDPSVGAVVITGEGEKSFCAGGDVRSLYDEGIAEGGPAAPPQGSLRAEFFRNEYRLNHRIHTFPKPFIAVMDGITMGGGVGLSRHGSIRIATERTMIAMPETGIGLFPDVGGGWFLNRAPGDLGTYLGLTGHRIHAADALFAGFATHAVHSEALPDLMGAFEKVPVTDLSGERLSQIISSRRMEPGPAPLLDRLVTINRWFSADTIEEIMARLESDGTDFARETLAALNRMSPTSLKVSLSQIRRCRDLSYPEVAVLEYRLSQAAMAHHDFFEGIRAVLVDKDKSPKWNPATSADVAAASLEGHFQAPASGDLSL